ncbi:MAG: septum formation inhibitor Maf [Clostridia bacterium]|nr:septum formation inhibitor Maf [Clostridia bacterium]
MKRIILASGSPRRKELMTLTRLPFEVIVTDADESVADNLTPSETVEILSRRKAEAIKENGIVIGSDTVVAINGEILGKPEDKEDAKRILRMLSGNVHQVYTGVTIIDGKNIDTFSVKTDVEFYDLTEKEIDEYISLPECYDKAGAYGIQGMGGLFVKSITGDYNNVVGLPIAEVYRKIKVLKGEFV